MDEITNKTSQRLFALGGFSSALLTLMLGAFQITFLVFGTGIILPIVLFGLDSLMQSRRLVGRKPPVTKRLLAGLIVAASYLCGVVVFVAFVSLSDRLGIATRNFVGLNLAGGVTSVGFYWALTTFSWVKRNALFSLLFVAFFAALVAGTTPLWSPHLLILGPGFVISPFWVSLLVIGETGFAWVWGNAQLLHDARDRS